MVVGGWAKLQADSECAALTIPVVSANPKFTSILRRLQSIVVSKVMSALAWELVQLPELHHQPMLFHMFIASSKI